MWVDLTDFDGKALVVNSDNITHVSAAAESALVFLASGKILTVKEGCEQIKAMVSEF
jgi:uncharacterized protein YlzI (FlbEa/FlbD family)